MNEKWKPIKGLEENYFVSDLGRIKPVNPRYKNSKFLKTTKNKNGYVYVTLCNKTKRKCLRVHRVVASSFLKNLNKKPFVNHKNGNKSDNRVVNLEWATAKENSQHALDQKVHNYYGQKHHRSKLTEKQVFTVIKQLSNGKSTKELSVKFKVTPETIRDIRSGRTWNRITKIKKTR